MDHALELSSDTSLPLNSPTGFDDFWAAYPRKVGKQAAIRAWPAASRFAQQIADDLRTRQDWSDPTYIPHPSTYLHGRRWEDRPAPPKPAEPKGFAGIRTFLGGESKERQPRPPLRPCWPGLSQEAFGREFATLSAAYPHRELPPETAVVYFQACRHLSPIRFQAAVAKVIQLCHFFPSIAEILTAARTRPEQARHLLLAEPPPDAAAKARVKALLKSFYEA